VSGKREPHSHRLKRDPVTGFRNKALGFRTGRKGRGVAGAGHAPQKDETWLRLQDKRIIFSGRYLSIGNRLDLRESNPIWTRLLDEGKGVNRAETIPVSERIN